MPFWRFIALTTLGSIPWVLALALIGESVGHNWESWRHPPRRPRLRGPVRV
jgi:membrane protein DedA with SNARE-associated domain